VVTLKTSHCIELVEPEFPAYSLYGKLVLTGSSHNDKFRSYQLAIKQCC
jgi:hypothetical protein